MKFNSASPFFSKEEIKKIILEIKDLLSGKGLLMRKDHWLVNLKNYFLIILDLNME